MCDYLMMKILIPHLEEVFLVATAVVAVVAVAPTTTAVVAVAPTTPAVVVVVVVVILQALFLPLKLIWKEEKGEG